MSNTIEKLANFVGGQWQIGSGEGAVLTDPVLGTPLVSVDASGIDLAAAMAYAREVGGPALRALTYPQRADLLKAIVGVLNANREAYYDISVANSGTVKNDTAVDVDGGIYTLGYYAKLGAGLPAAHHMVDGEAAVLSKDGLFQSQHIYSPLHGVALFINAFNFPSWGLWEKAAPALLSGMPVIVKPATATAWLTQRMVKDVIDAGILPAGALSVVCGSAQGLLDAVLPFDVVSFTGSADTAQKIRSHPAVLANGVRVGIEADSINSALLMPGEAADSPAVASLVREVVNEMKVKSGQKCTAIRRIFVPEALYDTVAQAISAKLATLVVGDPRLENVQMGALVNRAQYNDVKAGIAALQQHCDTLYDGSQHALEGVSAEACVLAPTLLGTRTPDTNPVVHHTEVFGPCATLMPYRDLAHAVALAERGQGALVCSIYGTDPAVMAQAALALAPAHGRVHAISPDVAKTQTGHGNVMPQSMHGGPGRAGGGEELGGVRALAFYHRRSAVQASSAVLGAGVQ